MGIKVTPILSNCSDDYDGMSSESLARHTARVQLVSVLFSLLFLLGEAVQGV